LTSTYTPVLAIPEFEDPEVVSTAIFNRPLVAIDGAVQHKDVTSRPWFLKAIAYDAPNNRIDLTLGPGRTYSDATKVEDAGDTHAYVATPAITTTYWVYKKISDGTYLSNTTGVTPAGSFPLWKVTTGVTVATLSYADIRGQLQVQPSPTGVVASTYGNATTVPTFAVDAYGRVTSVVNVAIAAGTANVADASITPIKLSSAVPGRSLPKLWAFI
jgi:hypothetical protein